MIPDLTYRAAHLHEDMDALDGDLATLHRTYRFFPAINAIVSGWWWIYWSRIRPQLSKTVTTTLLDVGCGGGDITRNMVMWADREGLRLDTTGIDTDPRAIDYAHSMPPLAGARYENVSSHELVRQGRKYDLVISNHMLHHLQDEEVVPLLDDLRDLAKREVILSDVGRTALSYFLFSSMIAPFFPRSFCPEDGLTSIRRAFTPEELKAILPAGWTYTPQFFHRHLVRYRHQQSGG